MRYIVLIVLLVKTVEVDVFRSEELLVKVKRSSLSFSNYDERVNVFTYLSTRINTFCNRSYRMYCRVAHTTYTSEGKINNYFLLSFKRRRGSI